MSRALRIGERTCRSCGRGLVSHRQWGNATARCRAEWIALGLRKAGSHGNCASCSKYRREERRALCNRCGRARIIRADRPTDHGLCRDCWEVTVELGELQAWAS